MYFCVLLPPGIARCVPEYVPVPFQMVAPCCAVFLLQRGMQDITADVTGTISLALRQTISRVASRAAEKVPGDYEVTVEESEMGFVPLLEYREAIPYLEK
jgi:hypothetical protein